MPDFEGGWFDGSGGTGSDPGLFDATCAPTLAVGLFVHFTGVPGPEVEAADSYSNLKIPAVGVIVDKPTSTTCTVRRLGQANSFASLIPGKVYWLGAAGGVLAAPPAAAPGTLRYAQVVGYALNPTTMMVDINTGVHGFNN